ncbi:MAG: thiamine pyrophosphate-binding protein [Candidatus ainarchaeum sp.]|nr:thiamine pyrophosphate-binding protein [Candidatus ainarchaeum sp.]
MKTISEIIIEFIKFLKIDTIFGIPGSNLDFLKYLSEDKVIKFIVNKDEKNSPYMAMGYTKSSNKISCCFGSVGAGVFNLIPGTISAYYESVPLLIIGGQTNLKNKGKNTFQEASGCARSVSQLNEFKKITLYNCILNEKKLFQQLEKVFFSLNDFRSGPVYIEFPSELMNLKINFNKKIFCNMKINFNRYRLDKFKLYDESKKVIQLIIDLNKSKKPVILIGNGVKDSKEIIKLSSKFRIPIFSTFKGKDRVTNNFKYYMGCLGLIGSSIGNNYFKESDLLISIGSSLSQFTTDNWKLIDNKNIYRIDTINDDITKHKGIVIKSDYSDVFKKLLSSDYKGNNNIVELKQSIDNELNKFNSPKINLIRKLRTSLSKDSIIVTEDIFLIGKYFKFYKNDINLNFTNIAPIGCALSGGIGAQIANSKKKVIVILGDGGFNMNISELNTIMNYKIPLKIILINNNGYGIVYKSQIHKFKNNFYTQFKNPDYFKLSQSYNFTAYNINNVFKLSLKKLKKIINSNKTELINVKVDIDEKIGIKIY